MNYFPGNDQKNGLNGSSATFSKCEDVQWCERLLLLPWGNLPSPPQGRNRETTEEGREGEKTVCSRSQFANQGHVLFSQHNTSLLWSVSEQPERKSQMSAWYVGDLCSSRLAGMDYERTHDFCLMCLIHILAYVCDVLVKGCTCMSIHVDGCRATLWT